MPAAWSCAKSRDWFRVLRQDFQPEIKIWGDPMGGEGMDRESLWKKIQAIECEIADAIAVAGPAGELVRARNALLVQIMDFPPSGDDGQTNDEVVESQDLQSGLSRTPEQEKERDDAIAPDAGGSSGYLRKLTSQGATFARGLIKKGQETYSAALQDAFASDSTLVVPIDGTLIIGRDPTSCQYILDNVQVSRRHTQIEQTNTIYVVSDLGSSNGTYLNGALVRGHETLQTGDVLNIGPYHLTFDGQSLITNSNSGDAEIICNSICKEVTDRATGKKILILNNVSLCIKPCEFTVIIGPSGGGKSTLLNALSGRNPASSGEVLVNGQNLYTHFDALKKNMALVPQKDVLHSALRLRHALLYTARLRLPPELGIDACGKIVDEYLQTVSLTERTGTTIKDLSGGQIKRASLANEIISQPNLLFVDEATSGLDEHTDGEIMQIFREIAEGGKTVVCITHNLTNVEKFCHKVVILAPGGFLAFVGTADEAREYFNIDTLGDVYIRLRDKPSKEWRDEFAATSEYEEMYAEVQKHRRKSKNQIERRRPSSLAQKIATFVRQLSLLSQRGWEIQLSDLKSLFVMGLQCVFVALLICILFGEIPNGEEGVAGAAVAARAAFSGKVIFLLTVSSFWFGCNNAAKEIVKDKEIYERERDVFLNVTSYYSAKFLMLAMITMGQVILLLSLVNYYTGLPGSFWSQAFFITTIGICGVSTGLLISSVSRNTDMAVTLVPVAIIPQVILAGLIFPIDGFAELLSNVFISCYWGYGNMMSSLPEPIAEAAKYGNWSYLSSGVVMIHAGLMIIMANAVLYAADKRLSLKGSGIDKWLKNAAKRFQGASSEISEAGYSESENRMDNSLPDVMVDMPPTFVLDEKTAVSEGEVRGLPDVMMEPPPTLQVVGETIRDFDQARDEPDRQPVQQEAAWTLFLPGRQIPLLTGLRLLAADLTGMETDEPDGAVAEVVPHPQDPEMIGLRNLSKIPWNVTMANGNAVSIDPGKNVRMETGVAIEFGSLSGVVK